MNMIRVCVGAANESDELASFDVGDNLREGEEVLPSKPHQNMPLRLQPTPPSRRGENAYDAAHGNGLARWG